MGDFLAITYSEAMWLKQHGGRSAEDVIVDEDGRKYVYMSLADGGYERVYIPKYATVINTPDTHTGTIL